MKKSAPESELRELVCEAVARHVAAALPDAVLFALAKEVLGNRLALLNATQAGEMIGISRNEVKRLGVPPVRIGARSLYRACDLEAAIAARKGAP